MSKIIYSHILSICVSIPTGAEAAQIAIPRKWMTDFSTTTSNNYNNKIKDRYNWNKNNNTY